MARVIGDAGEARNFELELFVVGRSAKSEAALGNLRRLCDRFLSGRHAITVIDVLDDPAAAETANVVATPTLIRRAPLPVRRVVGDLSKTDAVLAALGIEHAHRSGGEQDNG
jgi:circadian clock protein KaiB